MSLPPLPRLEISENTWVLYENIAIHDTDRSANWRFMIQADGCYFHARNREFYLADPALIDDADPDLHWNQPFVDAIRCLTNSQQEELAQAIDSVDPSKLSEFYASASGGKVSHPSAERWTIIQGNETHTIVVENGNAPSALVELRQTIDDLVANAPRVD